MAIQPTPASPAGQGHDDFAGFDHAEQLLFCHAARARTRCRLEQTPFLADGRVIAVHLDNTSRADRIYVSAFDAAGALIDGDVLYIDHPGDELPVTPEFDHDFTGLEVPVGSDLEHLAQRDTGWIANLDTVREYDFADDRKGCQRQVFLAHLGDLLARNEAQGFIMSDEDASGAA